MRAISYADYEAPPTVGEVADPDCPRDGVVLEVRATGVCRSDWHAWMGHDPVPGFPHVPGHEYAGVIAAVGGDVTRWSVGDRVVAPFALGCATCATCESGALNVCPNNLQPGFTSWGSFADLVAVPRADANLVALPEAVGFVEAAALGCRFATSYHAVVERAQLVQGEWLAVHGCGGIGLSALMVGVALGARVIAVDVSEVALAAARDLGAEAAVLGPDGVVEQVLEITGDGAHVSVDALGSVATMRASLECLRPRGRHLQVGLMLGDASDPPVPLGRVLSYELALLGSHGMPSGDYAPMLDLVASGRLRPELLVGRVIGLAEAGAALASMSGPSSGPGMTVVDMDVR